MKNRYKLIGTIAAVVLITLFAVFITLIQTFKNNTTLLSIIATLMFSIIFVNSIIGYNLINKRRAQLNKSFNYYVERMISNAGVGMISLNEKNEIIWASEFIESRFNRKKIIGKKADVISSDFAKKYLAGKQKFNFTSSGTNYEAQLSLENRVILFKDINKESIANNQYKNEQLVIGELEIDNFQQFQVLLSEEGTFNIRKVVVELLDKLVKDYNIAYRQYINGKYIIITNYHVLEKLYATGFSFLEQVRKHTVMNGVQLTISVGFGAGSSLNKEMIELAKEGLGRAQSRGGDQVCLLFANKKPEFFGSKTEIAKNTSKVKIKYVAQSFEARLQDESIENVIIYPHISADLDAIGAAVGIAEIAKAYNKNAWIQSTIIDETTTRAMRQLFNKDLHRRFIRTAKARRMVKESKAMVVIVDVCDLGRIENQKAFEGVEWENIFIFDHHRLSGKLDENIRPTNVYIDNTASSAVEIISEIYRFLKRKVSLEKPVAQMMMNGLYLDTITFSKFTSARSFEAAAWFESFGASTVIATNLLKHSPDVSLFLAKMNSSVEEVKPGYFLASYNGEVETDVISKAADEILRTRGRKAAFVVAKLPGGKKIKMSARGIETNVQIIAEEVNGGGHFSAAAAVSSEPLEIFVNNIKQAIVDRGE